jgi:hypothetical protein
MAAHDRERKLDIQKLTPEQADSVSQQIGEKIRQITEKAVLDANQILQIYGMEAQMQLVVGELGKIPPAIEPKPSKKGTIKSQKRRSTPKQS